MECSARSIVGLLNQEVRRNAAISSPSHKKMGTLILRLDAGTHSTQDYEKIEASIQGLDGVISTKINYVTGMIKIEFDPKKLSFENIHSELNKAQKFSE